MGNYTVKDGETIASIADRYGLASWKRIYDHPDNAGFRQKRPNPNLVYPGDIIFVPDQETITYDKPADQEHKFTLKRPKQWLRIKVEDYDTQPLAHEKYKLKVGDRSYEGTTDGTGLLEIEIDVQAASGRLTIGEHRFDLSIGDLNPIQQTPDGGVSGVQGRLRNLGYPTGAIDGLMGPKTSQAIRYFQADEALPVTGEMDSATRKCLIQRYGG
jgi:N-acetylmuramoyl-L-alanine amidase